MHFLERLFGVAAVRSNPDPRNNCLFDPRLILLSEQSNVDKIVECLAGSDKAMILQLVYMVHYSLEICIIQHDGANHAQENVVELGRVESLRFG